MALSICCKDALLLAFRSSISRTEAHTSRSAVVNAPMPGPGVLEDSERMVWSAPSRFSNDTMLPFGVRTSTEYAWPLDNTTTCVLPG
eukprot:6505453-Pyramimonas_sp.AAC.2